MRQASAWCSGRRQQVRAELDRSRGHIVLQGLCFTKNQKSVLPFKMAMITVPKYFA